MRFIDCGDKQRIVVEDISAVTPFLPGTTADAIRKDGWRIVNMAGQAEARSIVYTKSGAAYITKIALATLTPRIEESLEKKK